MNLDELDENIEDVTLLVEDDELELEEISTLADENTTGLTEDFSSDFDETESIIEDLTTLEEHEEVSDTGQENFRDSVLIEKSEISSDPAAEVLKILKTNCFPLRMKFLT